MEFSANMPVPLPRFAGSAWRGAFGHSLRRTVCALRHARCAGCPLFGTCAYPTIFEPPVRPDAETTPDILPVAYVLAPESGPASGVFPPGTPIVVTLRLFGRAAALAGYAVSALAQAAAGGIGPARLPLALKALTQEDGAEPATTPVLFPPSPPLTGPVRVTLRTPLRLRLNGDLVTQNAISPADLLTTAVRRVAAIRRLHGGFDDCFDFRSLKAQAALLDWEDARFHWTETARRSSRQGMLMQFGGLMGEACLDLRSTPDLWSFLWLSQWLHLGKGASMGFGQFRARIA